MIEGMTLLLLLTLLNTLTNYKIGLNKLNNIIKLNLHYNQILTNNRTIDILRLKPFWDVNLQTLKENQTKSKLKERKGRQPFKRKKRIFMKNSDIK